MPQIHYYGGTPLHYLTASTYRIISGSVPISSLCLYISPKEKDN
jgi:hypothetical protein